MIDSRTKLTILHDNNSVFSDHTDNAADFIRDEFSLDLVSLEDYLYIGYRKKFGTIYCEFVTPNTNTNSFTAEYYNGTAWTAISLNDETKGFTRSGFISWEKASMASTSVNSIDKFYIRLKPSADHSLTSVRGINLVFVDDNALKSEFFEIDNSNILPPNETSHISTHVASRNHIIQSLRNLGYIRTNSTGVTENIDQWDLHDIYEVKHASLMLSLSKIFFTLSDSVDDHWWAKYKEYQDKYEEAFKLVKLSLDTDDDGTEDVSEQERVFKSQRWSR